mgnify:CR=1 FL=1
MALLVLLAALAAAAAGADTYWWHLPQTDCPYDDVKTPAGLSANCCTGAPRCTVDLCQVGPPSRKEEKKKKKGGGEEEEGRKE